MKRILAFLVSMSLILTCLSGISLVAFAADDLVLGDVTITHDGSGYVIDTPDKFVAVFGNDNTAKTFVSGMVYHITADIDLSGVNYVPGAAIFKGTITGWENGSPAKKHINIGTVTRTPVTLSSNLNAGGIIHNTNGAQIEYITTSGTVTVDAAVVYAGGIVAYASGNTVFDNIDNGINVTVTSNGGTGVKHVGGIVAMAYNTANITYVTNSGNITNNSSKGTAGGIAGGMQCGEGASQRTVSHAFNSGTILSSKNYAGGIAAQSYFIMENCGNEGAVSGTRAGGLTGYSSQTETYYRNCFNTGAITGSSAAGGLVGTTYADAGKAYREIRIVNGYNLGTVSAADGVSGVELGAAIGDPWHSGATVGSDTGSSSITNFYDPVNTGLPLFTKSQATFVGVDVTNSYVYADADDLANNKATRATILTKFLDEAVWDIDPTADYIYPTLVSNIYDDDLAALEEPEEPEETYFEKNGITGAGTASNPYIINTAEKFNAIFGNVVTDTALLDEIRAADYAITQDIDLSGIENYQSNLTMGYFTGELYGSDGNGNKVMRTINIGTGRTYAGKDGKYAGGIVNSIGYGTKISYLTLEGSFSTTASEATGGLVGIVGGGSAVTINNVINKINVTGVDTVGGIAGHSGYANLTITNCHNKGNITATVTYPVGGIIANGFNPQIEGCSNTGTITNQISSGNAYVGGIIGLFRMDKFEKDAYIRNSWNAGELVTAGARVGGIAGILWKHKNAVSLGEIYDRGVEISNCYNVGTFAGGATVTGHIFGYNNTDKTTSNTDPGYTNKPIISGCYAIDASVPLINDANTCAKNTGVTYTNNYVYTLNDSLEYEGATKVNKANLIGLTSSSDAVFSNTANWVAGSGDYPYPQLAGNPYTGHAVNLPDDPILSSYTVDNIEVYYDNGAYKIRWTAEAAADSYELKYGDNTAAVTLNGDITSIIKDKELDIQVIAKKDTTSYPSGIVIVNGYYGGGTGVLNDEYLIYDADHFANIELNPSAQYKQMANFTVTTPLFLQEDKNLKYNEAKTYFGGTYNGNDKTITIDFVYDNNGDPAYGLFSYMGTSTIKNLNVDGQILVKNNGEEIFISPIVAAIRSGSKYTIENCNNYADVVVTADYSYYVRTGGILCVSYLGSPTGTVTGCANYGDLEGSGTSGIVYRIRNKETITNCANYGKITATANAGGIVSFAEGGTITGSFNMGEINGNVATGIVASVKTNAGHKDVVITDCYNIGTLSGNYTAGVLKEDSARATGKAITVTNCYNLTSSKHGLVMNYNAGTPVTVENSYFVDSSSEDENAVTLEELKNMAETLGASYTVSGDFIYPQLKNKLIDEDKDGVQFVAFNYNNDGKADINRKTSVGYVQKGSEVTFFVESKDADFTTITVKANDVEIDEGIIEEKGFKLVINEDTVIYVFGETIEAGTPEIEAGTEILASTGENPITVGGTEYTRYAISAGRAPKVTGLKLKEFGVLINLKDDGFTLETAKAVAKADSQKISDKGAYGILIHGDGETGIKSNMTYYTRPYAIYEDADGKDYTVYGQIQSFVLAAPVEAE